MNKCAFAACILFSLTACQWVKPSAAGKNVALVKPAHVSQCEKLATTTSSSREKVGFVERKERKVADELVNLAKNEAAKIQGDTIVAVGPMTDGQQTFEIYRCQ